MGNSESASKYDISSAINYENYTDEPDYPYLIEIDCFSKKSMNYIHDQIIDIENVVLYKHINQIMYVLSRTIEEKSPKIMNQTDYFLFRHHNVPILKINNTSAKMNQWTSNGNTNIHKCIVCDIDQIDEEVGGIFTSIPNVGLS